MGASNGRAHRNVHSLQSQFFATPTNENIDVGVGVMTPYSHTEPHNIYRPRHTPNGDQHIHHARNPHSPPAREPHPPKSCHTKACRKHRRYLSPFCVVFLILFPFFFSTTNSQADLVQAWLLSSTSIQNFPRAKSPLASAASRVVSSAARTRQESLWWHSLLAFSSSVTPLTTTVSFDLYFQLGYVSDIPFTVHLSTWASKTCQTVTNAVSRTPQEQHSLDGFRGTIWGQPNGIDCLRRNILILCARFP